MGRLTLLLILFYFLCSPVFSFAGSFTPTVPIVATEQGAYQIFAFFDLRDRESYLQVMNTGSSSVDVHVQIFNAGFNCNENDFFDEYTSLDTHIYNFRNILTNSGNPSGLVMPDNSYGFVAITVIAGVGGNSIDNPVLIGSFRIVDDAGFEYRTNAAGLPGSIGGTTTTLSFNYHNYSGTAFADIVGITVDNIGLGHDAVTAFPSLGTFMKFRPRIYNENENAFSCSDFVFACIENDDDPLYSNLLTTTGVSKAGMEFGINDAVPHSKDKGKICVANNVTKGFVRIETLNVTGESQAEMVIGFVGLNDGGNRSSMEIFAATP